MLKCIHFVHLKVDIPLDFGTLINSSSPYYECLSKDDYLVNFPSKRQNGKKGILPIHTLIALFNVHTCYKYYNLFIKTQAENYTKNRQT